MIPIREHIIALIQQYIYTNGEGKITAAQLKEILLEIANAFAINGGIDTVLQAGSVVSDGRVITNEKNGTFRLEAKAVLGEITRKYIGFDVEEPTFVGATYTGSDFTSTGTVKRNNASRSIFQIFAGGLQDGEIGVFTSHSIDKEEPKVKAEVAETSKKVAGKVSVASEAPSMNGNINSVVRTVDVKSYDRVQTDSVESGVSDSWSSSMHEIRRESINSSINTVDGSNNTYINQNINSINQQVNSGPQTSYHIQNSMSFEASLSDSNSGAYFSSVLSLYGVSWRDSTGEVVNVRPSGLGITSGKRLTLGQSGAAPTAGIAKLAGGKVDVNTSAVRTNSVISLTVQEGGNHAGNIRVASKVANTRFSLASSNGADDCLVFWQIIDLE